MKLSSTWLFTKDWNFAKSCLLCCLILSIIPGFIKCRRSVEQLRVREEIIPADSLSFIVIGDWGKYGNQDQSTIAKQIFRQGKNHNVQFVITTGDNFYPSGVTGTEDVHWKLSFEDVYLKDSIPVNWFPVLGNHDYGSNPQAQVDYSSVNKRWNMPGRFYALKRKLAGTDSVLFVFTDSSPFIVDYHNPPNILADLKKQDTAAQLKWIQSTLSSSKEPWRFVIGHHPIYSVGAHGNAPELIRQYKPLFLKYNVDFYLAGHDHDLQLIKQPNESLRYLVSGAGSEAREVSPDANTIFAKATTGFLVVTLYTNKAHIYFYDKAGSLLFEQQVYK